MRREAGVALITALLVVALAAAMASALAARQFMDVRRTGNVTLNDQAYLYALGIEDLAAQFLSRYAQQQKYDAERDLAQAAVTYAVEGGMVSGRLVDLEGRFNLNSLVNADGSDNATALRRFRRLLLQFGLDPELANAVADWIDPDSEPRFPGGAEDDTYLGQDPPYRAANRPMASPTELLLVAGFDRAILYGDEEREPLLPHLAALPEAATTININTADVQVLRSLSDKMDDGTARVIVEARRERPFKAVADLLSLPPFKDWKTEEKNALTAGLDVQSSYFLVQARVNLDRARFHLNSLLYRRSDGARVIPILRSWDPAGGV